MFAELLQADDELLGVVGGVGVAALGRLREMAADGPVVLDLDDGPVVVELNAPVIIEHPRRPGSSGS